MKTLPRHALLAAALALAIPAAARPVPQAAEKPAHAAQDAEKLPDARTLVDRHIAASGGLDKLEKSAQGTMKGSFSMPAANMTAPMVVWAMAPDRMATQIELPGMGVIQSGIKDGIVWALDPFQGPRILDGVERAQQIESLHPDATRRLPSFVANMAAKGFAEFDGKRCYKVEIEWKSGRKSWDCYGVDDGLMLASGGKQKSPMGDLEMVSVIKEYRDFDGMKMPAVTEVTSMGQKQVIRIDSFDSATPDASAFDLPPAIQALAAQKP